ncbi:Panacea domain-containing protein [Timonella senegalensis]|uniref:Panacea domain-containing protein n=1 Tax=Timonella senegalensis TaxID=1465825 RepID=UPI0028AA1019|nr:type II toxin-antitoxin system antitoxin SocA domain-containing protein [Timonella senegalensis]
MTTTNSALVLARQIEQEYGVLGGMQLQKLVYYSEVWAQVLGGSLFADPIEAWRDGPVVRDVWVYRRYGGISISEPELSPLRRTLLDAVIPFYSRKSGTDLSAQTHAEAPWKDAYAKGVNTPIERIAIRRFYARQALLTPDQVPDLPDIRAFRPSAEDIVHQAKDISGKWERTLTILGS